MIIAFFGASGSGKSTLVNEIIKLPTIRNKKFLIHKEDDFLLLRIAKKILGNDLFKEYNQNKMSIVAKKENRIFSSLVYYAYPLVVYLEFFALFIVYKFIFKEKILICDRYIYDYIVTFKNNLKIDNSFNMWFFLNFPRPDLLFFLDIDAATLSSRNKSNRDVSIVFTKSFQNKVINDYRSIANSKNFLIIDTTKGVKGAVKVAIKHMVNRKKLSMSKEIAICGLDGVGKTTVCNLFYSYCVSLNIPCKVVHFYHNNILLILLRSVGLLKGKPLTKVSLKKSRTKNESRKERHFIISFTLALLHFTDSYIQNVYFRLIYSKSLIIFDRYFYDYLISFQYFDVKGWQGFENFVPDVKNKFLIINNPAIAYERKPEANVDFYKFEHEAYIKLARRKNIKIINAMNKSPEYIMNDIINKLNK